MKLGHILPTTLFALALFLFVAPLAHADTLTLTSGNNATTTPSVATSITGFQIVGPSASTTPVKIHVTNGTVHVSTVSGVTMSGNGTATLNLSGTVSNLNTALSSLTYTRSSTGTDTLEVALVSSTQIYFPDNGHVYQYVASALTWGAAKIAAEALSAYGASGYLVTITSSAENNFVKARLSGNSWIGASDVSGEGDWKWVTGPEAGTSFWSGIGSGHTVGGNYASWASGEPNDSGSNEDCGEEYVADGMWNDLPCSGTVVDGYVAEFGSDADPATVVSKDVSIVTADVPAVTSLSPITGAVNVATTTDLVINFSKSVSPDNGSILIKKTSDDSTVESIPVSDARITGGGTSAITIHPDASLEEGVQYYIVVPSTAFEDVSSNHFDGITESTTWSFTTADLTAPLITSVEATSTASTTASITWTTNELASSKAVYSVGSAFTSTTTETDTAPRVTGHTKVLSGLSACTSYNYEVVSADAAGNYATSTSAIFTTLGCPGASLPASTTISTVSVSSAATTTLTQSGRTLTVKTPAGVTATSSSIVIQIHSMDASPVLSAVGMPSNSLSSAASVVFDVTALIDDTTVLDSFDTAVTITYQYTDADIVGLDESTLRMYHYHDGAWIALDICSVSARSNTITCDTPSFSTFAIFGSVSATGSRTGTTIQAQVANLEAMGKIDAANALKTQWRPLFPTAQAAAPQFSTSSIPVRDLKLGMTGPDVLLLQKVLNTNGFPLTSVGVGAIGQETIYFGQLTKNALAKYQIAHGINPSVGYFGPMTRAQMKATTVGGT